MRFPAVGDRVLVYHIQGCGRCANCRSGYMISCSNPGEKAAYGWQRDGGHAEFMVADAATCIPLPDELSFVDGALIACGFGTADEGLRRIGVNGADELLVVGLGPVGLAAAMIGRGLGATRVFGVEPHAGRRAWAEELGLFDEVFEPSDAGDGLAHATRGRGCSTAIDCSGNVHGRGTAVAAIAEWGRISLVGEGGRLETEVSDALLHKQVSIHASWVTSLQRMERLARELVAWGLRPERIVSHRFDFEHADEAYRVAASAASGKVVIVPGGGA